MSLVKLAGVPDPTVTSGQPLARRTERLTVPGDPVPWAPKQTNRNTGNRFIPGRQGDAIGRVLGAVESLPAAPFLAGVPLILTLTFYVRRPKSHYGSGRNSSTIKNSSPMVPTGRPDLSNLVKLVEDGLVLGGLVPDDDQVVSISAAKVYTKGREEQPRTDVEIRESWL